MDPAPQYHFGVYARIHDAGQILLVRKTRGRYTGLLDLPGGQPEPGEAWSDTLERELHEELGLTIKTTGDFRPFAVRVRGSSSGVPIDFRHHGVVLDVRPPIARPTARTSPDTAGFEWFDLRAGDGARLSPVVRAVRSVVGA